MRAVRIALIVAAGLAVGADWPQWRGPDRTGVSAETDLLTKFPAGGPKLVWTYDKAGIGFSSVSVVGDRLYSMGQDDKDEYVFALDVKSGDQVWKQPVGANYQNRNGSGPRCAPTVDGDALYVLTAPGDLACLATADGKVRWTTNIEKKYKGKMMSSWGYSESVLVDGDLVLCCPGGDEGHVAAFAKKDGSLKWRSTGLSATAGYSSMIVSNAGGVRHYVQLTPDGLAGFAPKDGKVLWQLPMKGMRIAVIPTPIAHGDYVYGTSDYGYGCACAQVTSDGKGGLKAEKVYEGLKDMQNHHGGVVCVGDHIYGSSGNANGQKSLPLVCQELKTGKVVWKSNLEPSAIVAAGGHLYCYGQSTGVLACVKATPEGFTETGRFTIPKQSSLSKPRDAIWAHPVIANGKLYLRDQDLLYCFDIKPGPVTE
ncbi:MAG: PQQ-binding-like beta-propeller repeat protein [Gemmataceae bacterium]